MAAAIGAALSLASGGAAAADETARQAARNDYLFPRGGDFSASAASGYPFLGIGELAYGVTDRFAIGAFGAATPDVGGVKGTLAMGLRPRGVLFDTGAWRSTLMVPVLYYPDVKGFGDREPWMLVRPTLALERELPSGARVNVTLGLLGAACMDSILSLGKEHVMMGGVWETAGLGGALPISSRTSVFAEASLIMNGVVPARDWIGGLPVVGFAGVTTTL